MIKKILSAMREVSFADRVIIQKIVKTSNIDFLFDSRPGYKIVNLYESSKKNTVPYKNWLKYDLDLYKFNEEVYTLIQTGEFHCSYEESRENGVLRKLFDDVNLNRVDTYLIEEDYFVAFHYYKGNNYKPNRFHLEPYFKELERLR